LPTAVNLASPRTPDPPPGTTPTRLGGYASIAPIAVASALFMDFIDSTALSTALPTLARAFHSDPVHLKLALTSYIMALAVFTPASGWVADRYGAKRVFLIAMSVFLTGSILCALSRSLPALVASRIVQGMGGAMMTPVGRLIVVGSVPRERLVSAMAAFTMPALVGPMIGPPLAGLVLTFADWPWIFLINLPVGLAGMTAVTIFAPKIVTFDPGPFDWRGFMLCATAITSLVAVAETFGVGLMPVWLMSLLGVLGLATLAGFVRHALTAANPILNLKLFQSATLRASILGGSFVRLALGAWPFLLPLLLQVAMGWSPGKAGLVSMGQAIGAFSAKPASTLVIRTLGFRTLLIGSAVLSVVFTALPGLYRTDTSPALIFFVLMLTGFVRSTHFTAVGTVAYAGLEGKDVGRANTLSAVVQQLSIGFGVSLGALMLQLARQGDGRLTTDRFGFPFLMISLAAAMAVPVYLGLRRDAGSDISRSAV
jgi:EmrB/QacA subfamily drug resistance transporter